MTLPVGEPVLIRLTAADVIHSWYVPAFFFKRDAIPGRVNEFEFTIEQPGTYGGQCAEFCGLLHSQMFFTIRAVEADQYQAWIDSGGTMTFAPGAGDDGDGRLRITQQLFAFLDTAGGVEVTYNPYHCSTFVDREHGSPVLRAELVVLADRVLAHNTNQ